MSYQYTEGLPGVFTQEAMKNYRSLDAHKFFVSGWVQTVLHKKVGGNHVLFKADVKPSWRVTEEPHHPWVAVKTDGAVVTAHCDCMAGLGESCSHVGALLLKVEAAVRLGYTSSACTDEICQWNACFVSKVTGAPVSEINFYTEKAKERLHKSKCKAKEEPSPSTEQERDHFMSSIADSGVVGLSGFTSHSDKFVPTTAAPSTDKLPQTLRKLYDVKHSELCEAEFKELCRTKGDLHITLAQVRYVEEVTRAQASSLVWHDQRAGRIISSTALHTSTSRPAPSLVKKICTAQPVPLRAPAVQWGREHEDTAFQQYTSSHRGSHTRCTTSKAGFTIAQTHPFLGASPDGIVNCSCCGEGLIEIKCPYIYRDVTVADATEDSKFCLGADMKIKVNHPYYTQMQMQMFVTNMIYCDLVVWTTLSCHVERVDRDEDFINAMVVKLADIWQSAIMPELLTRALELHLNLPGPSTLVQPQTNQILFCICRSPDVSDDMVACDSCDEWFHLKCLKLSRLPKANKWYCKNCKVIHKKGGKGKAV
ncbi:PREDICTED: uncharacterized protein LOC106816868 isoform X2 [Priapulus caudatus]|uniref:Uncharacterized protein LOC106816868 isoform X2 n=1 Tax=Priapulus caudatus TaxID=37621 RepID=A0ABM1EXS5_PRICU|nr:PREDICTED: uncharacterized protein LOC106816868 isoform X2 [Priapulus caudatus]